jgi:hypothetical protein
VLIEFRAQNAVMLGFLIITLLLIVGPLAVIAGVDSRVDDVSRRRLRR